MRIIQNQQAFIDNISNLKAKYLQFDFQLLNRK